MFKLVVLCAFFAAAAAKPGALIATPITQYATYLAPAGTTYRQDSGLYHHASPLFYQSSPLYTHFIKKRSPQFPLTYAAPATYYNNYLAASTYNTPLIHSTPYLQTQYTSLPATSVHFIKKRSAPLFPATYYAPATYAASAPLLTSTYTSTAPFYTHSPLISQPLAYTHLIKKRSAAPLTYIAPTSYSHQSRFDVQTTPYSSLSYAYTSPIAYSSPITYSSPLLSHLY